MNINTKNLDFVNFNNEEMQWVKFNNVVVYEAWKKIIASGRPPLTLPKCKGVDLVDYKIHGNSIQDGTPTPDTPIEVESVGEKTKNLIPYPFHNTSKTENGVTFTDNGDGTITVNGTATATTYFYFILATKNIIKPNITYTLSGITGGSTTTYELRVTDALTTAKTFYNGSRSFSYENTDNFSLVMIIRTGAVLDNLVVKPKLEEGSVATDYEPYGYKIPVKVSGKNLIDGQRLIAQGFVLQEDGSYYLENSKIPYQKILYTNDSGIEGKMTISFSIKYVLQNDMYGAVPVIYYTDGTHYNVDDSSKPTEFLKVTYTTPSDKTVDYISWGYNTGGAQTYIKDMQFEVGNSATEYEPYVEPITTNIYLNEPLRKIDTYADYIDFEKKQVIRQINKINLNDYTWYINNDGTYPFYYIVDVSPLPIISTASYSISNLLSGNYIDYNTDNIGINAYKSGIIRARPDLSVYDTLEKWQEYIKTNECYLIYPTEDVPQPIELPNIPTHKGTTIIEVDTTIQPSNMEVQYFGKEVR